MQLACVGISDYTCPVRVREKGGGMQETVARITLQAVMPQEGGRSCVSVLAAALDRFQADMSHAVFPALCAHVRERLEAESVELRMDFPYFIAKTAPVSRAVGLMEYECGFTGRTGQDKTMLTVVAPLTTLCPCSKEISRAGAHNQRAEVRLHVRPTAFIWLEDLISLVENSGSCQLYSLLKRPDEKYVTEAAYDTPMFVEDVARQVAGLANRHPHIEWFSVEVESFESIHKHSAYALVDQEGVVSCG